MFTETDGERLKLNYIQVQQSRVTSRLEYSRVGPGGLELNL